MVGTVLLAGAMLGGASQPAYATPGPPPDPSELLEIDPIAVRLGLVTCGGLTEAEAQAAGYWTSDNSAAGPVPGAALIVLGTPGPDWIVGSDFNDILDGQGGDDLLCGGDGPDDLRGLSGNDRMYGGNGFDRISGDTGTDQGYGGYNGGTCSASTETRSNC